MSRAARASVGELNERRWSVVSERGREAAGLAYADAAALMRRLLGEKVFGTCVVTDEAAARLADTPRPNGAPAADGNGAQPTNNGAEPTPAKKRRAPRRKRTEAGAGD